MNRKQNEGRIIMYIIYIIATFIWFLFWGKNGVLCGIMVILGHTGLYIIELTEVHESQLNGTKEE